METKLNNELIRATSPEDEKKCEPKRNSKEELIAKIIQVAQSNEITLQHSDTKLKRMTKQQLTEFLGEVVETAMRNEMARQVGAKPGLGGFANDARYLREGDREVHEHFFTELRI